MAHIKTLEEDMEALAINTFSDWEEKPNHNLNNNSLKEISFDDFLKFTGLTLDDVEYLKTL